MGESLGRQLRERKSGSSSLTPTHPRTHLPTHTHTWIARGHSASGTESLSLISTGALCTERPMAMTIGLALPAYLGKRGREITIVYVCEGESESMQGGVHANGVKTE
jgi:hypothetical protein